jgi:putative ABC transport system substrate-binding protein
VNTRRRLLIEIGAAATIPRSVFAQSQKSARVIGWISATGRESGTPGIRAFKEELNALGWREGHQIVVEERWTEGRGERLGSLLEELAAMHPVVVVTAPATATLAAAKASLNVPIVQAWGNSPVAQGLAASLARPGGMVTGLTNIPSELSEKFLELLLAAAPALKRIGFLFDPSSPAYSAHLENARRAVRRHKIDAQFAESRTSETMEDAVERLVRQRVQALIVMSSARFHAQRQRILPLALAQGWPVVSSVRSFAEDGALLTYGADIVALQRRAAHYVDRILKGAKPGELPIEQPMTFELVVNLKTARALGLTMPPEIMVQATRVIR